MGTASYNHDRTVLLDILSILIHSLCTIAGSLSVPVVIDFALAALVIFAHPTPRCCVCLHLNPAVVEPYAARSSARFTAQAYLSSIVRMKLAAESNTWKSKYVLPLCYDVRLQGVSPEDDAERYLLTKIYTTSLSEHTLV
jgi:hypothetical protein